MHYIYHQPMWRGDFLIFQQTSHYLRWGKPFTNKVFLGDEMTWSLWKGTPLRHDFWVLQLFRSTSWAFKQLVKVLGGHVQQIGDYSTSAYNNTESQLHNPELLAK